MQKRCLVLFSGGLDSILACKVLQKQGVEVIALKFITPFFSYDLKQKDQLCKYKEKARTDYGINVEVIDISREYIDMLKAPLHGYGRYFNPCIDCKILMIKKAQSLLSEYGASFIATGEVLGQRPMSQRRDALRIIERDSGAEGLLLRPLSSVFFKETLPEIKGIVDREAFPKIAGRSRKEQMRLAKEFGIKDYPTPAGGCVLTDPILSKRFRAAFERYEKEICTEDCLLAQVGRHFFLPGGGWLVVGRNKSENERLKRMVNHSDMTLKIQGVPGPFCILRYFRDTGDLELACKILARYGKGKPLPVNVEIRSGLTDIQKIIEVTSHLDEDRQRSLML